MYKKQFHIYSIFIIFCCFCLIIMIGMTGCKQSEDNKAYQGVGKLVAERHRARLAQSAERKGYTDREKKITSSSPVVFNDQGAPQETIFEKKVKIVSSSSGKILAKATAYLDRNGKIINITIDQN